MKMADEKIKLCSMHTEESRFALACITVFFILVPIVLLLIAVPTLIAMAGFYFFVFLAVFYFVLALLKYYMFSNYVEINQYSFPEVYRIVSNIKEGMGYDKKIDIFVNSDSSFEMFISRIFGSRVLLINLDVIEHYKKTQNKDVITWLAARHIGALKAKHFRFDIFIGIIAAIEKIALFNIFLFPYKRSLQYTGDQIGFLFVGSLSPTLKGMSALMIGKDLYVDTNVASIAKQYQSVRGKFFTWFSRLPNSYPHIIYRYMNLIAFARINDPDLYQTLVAQMPSDINLDSLCSDFGPKKKVVSQTSTVSVRDAV